MSNKNSEEAFEDFKKKELFKCMLDPIYFIENYVIVNEPSKGDVLFKLYPYQRDIIEGFNDHKKVILLCGRQMGKCIIGNTLITVNNTKVKIKKLLTMSIKEKIVNKLEDWLLKLAQ